MKAVAFAFVAAFFATQALAVPMTAWDAQKDGDPKTYDIGGLSLTLSSVKDDTNAFPVLTIHAKEWAPFTVRADDGGFPAATFGVGRFDPKGGDQQIVFTYFTGGAHCCDAVLLAEHVASGWRTIDLGKWDGGFATRRSISTATARWISFLSTRDFSMPSAVSPAVTRRRRS